MKTIPIFLLLLTILSATAKPEFAPLPGTPDSLAAQAGTNKPAAVVPVIAKPAVTYTPPTTYAPAASTVTTPSSGPVVDSFTRPRAAAQPVAQPASVSPATQKAITQAVAQAVSQAVTQTITPAVTQAVARAVSQTATQATPQVVGQPAPPAMPASMRHGTPGGFSVVKSPTATPPAGTPPPTVLEHKPHHVTPPPRTDNASTPIEMQASPAAPGVAASAPVVSAPVSVPAVAVPTAAVVAPTPVTAPAAAPVVPSADEFTVPNNATPPPTAPAAPAPVLVRTPPVSVSSAPSVVPPSMQAATPAPAVPPTVNVRPAYPAPTAPALPAFPSPGRPPQAAPAAAPEVPFVMHYQNMPLEQVLEIYSDMVNRTLLRPATLPTASITINTKNDLTKAEAIQALDSVLGLNGIAMIPVGEKFMKVVPIAQANQEGAPLGDQPAAELPELGQYVTHVVQLKYSKPSELAQVLQQFAKVPNSVFPIDSNNILILRDYTENVKRMLEMIERIDVAVPSDFVSEVIPIKYALADDIQSALSSISGSGGGGTSGSHNPTTSARPLAGTQNPSTSGGGAYGQNRTPGSLGASGSGTTGGANGAAGAQQTFAQRLQSIVQKASASGGDIQLIGPNKIIADERTNSLLVFATREDMETIKGIIAKLDVVLAQVLIEAIILDVSLGDSFNLGVTGGQRPATAGNSSFGGLINNPSGQLGTGNGFLNQLVQNFTTNIADNVTNVTSTFTPASSITYPNSDGLNYFGTLNNKWDFSLSALAGNNNVKVLARPRIQTSHAVAANIFVGETRPYITGTYFNSGVGGTSSSQYQQTQIGISLNVLPLINTEGLVVMDIQQQVQQVGGSVTIDGNSVPITQDQSASAKVAVYTGQTIVLGGFIQNQKSDSQSGVPLLKDIPLLGALFRSTTTSNNRRELLVMIRPTVLPTPSVAALQPDIERNRLPGIRQAESEFSKDQSKRNKKISKQKPADLDSE